MSSYKHLLSPVEVGGVLLKSRLTAQPSTPHFIQGAEPFPTEKWITLMANRARNGAAAVTIGHMERGTKQNTAIDDYGSHFSTMDFTSTSAHNYLCQMIDAIRYYGAYAMTNVSGTCPMSEAELEELMDKIERGGAGGMMPGPGPMGGGSPRRKGPGMGGPGGPGGPPSMREMLKRMPESMRADAVIRSGVNYLTKDQLHRIIEDSVKNAREYTKLGFDYFCIHHAYRNNLGAQFLSPLTNHRTDEYGGSVANRSRFTLELFEALRGVYGKDFPMEVIVSGEEAGGITVADTIEFAKLAEGIIDVIQIRHGEQDPQHPLGYTSTKEDPCPNLAVTAAVKEAIASYNGKLKVCATAGLLDPDFDEAVIRDGKADMISTARLFICEDDLARKLIEGRGDDIRPCIRCNKCHVPNGEEKFRSYCTVNPVIGIEDKVDRMIRPVTRKKKVGVIGAGPAGMEAALVAAQRGHDVTIFERNDQLGGQLRHAAYAQFKWPIHEWVLWMGRQLEKNGVKVLLGIEATPELLKPYGFDELIVAIGPRFTKASIPGIETARTMVPLEVFGHEAELPHNIAVIGGSETGVETGLYLAEAGHKVTVLSRQNSLASDAGRPHYLSMVRARWQACENFYEVCGVKQYVSMDGSSLTYIDHEGKEDRVDAELIVMATGAKPTPAECAKFYGIAPQTQYIGDCFRVSNMHFAIQHGFAAANQI